MSVEFVYVREEVLYFDRDRVHLADSREQSLEPQDAALIEIVLRGEAELGSLRDRVCSHTAMVAILFSLTKLPERTR